MFPNKNGAESSPTGKNYQKKISNFSNFPRKSEVVFHLCDSITHV